MRLLVLGGSRFLGRWLVETAVERGHEVTVFNRGLSPAALPRRVVRVVGDRDGGLGALTVTAAAEPAGQSTGGPGPLPASSTRRRWDAVIDTSGYIPRLVRDSAEFLSGLAGHYSFVSTLSVYPESVPENYDESTPVGTLADETTEEITGATYGPLKALCEKAVRESFAGPALVVRPGLIVGPYDQTDRFTYWPWRLTRGGEVLAPGSPAAPVQVIDVRDLATWLLDMAERGATGTFNAVGPEEPVPMGEILIMCRAAAGVGPVGFTWVDDSFLLERGVKPYTEMPLWIPAADGRFEPQADGHRAFAAGLRPRPLPETIADTLAWAKDRPSDYQWRGGLSREKEVELLREWHEAGSPGPVVPVEIVEYDPAWPAVFASLRDRVAAALGEVALSIEHMGSTSVPGLAAKPIIDIDVVVADREAVDEAIRRLAVVGYAHRGDQGIPGREAFSAPRGLPIHHLYVCAQDNLCLRENLLFRDRLRADPDSAAAYGRLKQDLARRYRFDREGYTGAKTEFVRSVLERSPA